MNDPKANIALPEIPHCSALPQQRRLGSSDAISSAMLFGGERTRIAVAAGCAFPARSAMFIGAPGAYRAHAGVVTVSTARELLERGP